MKFLLLPLILVLFCATLSYSQYTYKGRILDQQTHEPLIGATVMAANRTVGAAANERGEFAFTTAAPVEQITASFIGYEPRTIVAKPNEALHIQLQVSNTNLSEVTVVGYENNRKLLEVAGGVALLTARDIQRFDNSSVLPVLNTVPGVRMEAQSPGGSSRLSIRGSLLRSPFGIRGVKAYWADVPLTDAGGVMPYDILEPAIIGSIELLKGPAGSIYGAGTGGVLLFSPARSPFGEQSVELSATAGSYGLFRSGTTVRSGSEKANVAVSYIDQRYSGYREQQSSYRKVFSIAAQFYPSENRTVSVFAYNVRREFELPGALTLNEYQQNPRQALQFAKDGDTRLTSMTNNIGLSHTYRFSERFSNTTALYTSSYRLDHPWGTSAFNSGYSKDNSNSFGGRTRFNYNTRLGAVPTRLAVGAEFQNDNNMAHTFANNRGQIGALRENLDLVTSQYIGFGQAEFELPGNTILTLGASYNQLQYKVRDLLRHDSLSQTGTLAFRPTVAPRVALLKKLNEQLSAFASVSRGFGPPTRNEISVSGVVNRGLVAEQGTNYEVGMRGTLLDRKMNLDITSFRMSLNNIIVGSTNAAGLTDYANSGSANQYGVEAMLSYNLFMNEQTGQPLIKPWANYTFSNYRFDKYQVVNELANTTNDFSGNRIPGVSPHVVVAGLDVNSAAGFYNNLTFSYYGKRQINNANDVAMGGYKTLNMRSGYRRKISTHFEADVFAGLDNVMNEKYVSFLAVNGFGGRYYHMASPRNVFSGCSVKYLF